jgi:hypothetical protein
LEGRPIVEFAIARRCPLPLAGAPHIIGLTWVRVVLGCVEPDCRALGALGAGLVRMADSTSEQDGVLVERCAIIAQLVDVNAVDA